MRTGIAIAGNIVADRIKYIDGYPQEQTLATITGEAFSTGGLCCNCALTLAKLDPSLPIKAIGLLGDDELGSYAMSRFKEHPSIDISRIQRQGSTSYTDVMTDRVTGRRTFFHFRGANALLGPEHFDFTAMDAEILHIGYILLLDTLDAPDPEYPTAICRVLDTARKAGIQTSVDVVSEDSERFALLVPPALPYTDYCIINEIEASRAVGIPLRDGQEHIIKENLPLVCRKLMDMGVGRWVVLHTPELSCGLERDGRYIQKPSWNIPEGFKRSSVGAGDAYASGILYGAYHGWSLEQSIHTAGAVAAYSLSGAGASDAIRPLEELLGEMEGCQ